LNLFYQPGIQQGIRQLDADESRHAVKSLRLREGDTLDLTDGAGFFYKARITSAEANHCEFEIISKKESPRKNYIIHIAIAPTKNADRIEWLTEKAVEFGIQKLSFIACKNSERRNINMERIEKISINALKQSGQAWLPQLQTIMPFEKILGEQADQKFIAFVDSENPDHLKSLAHAGKNCLVLIGPEGDFSKEELELALKNNFQKVSLGSNRLRTETAGLAACHILNLLNS
jgi:16S rRNA (uracil1498-N3)-methyltransferase